MGSQWAINRLEIFRQYAPALEPIERKISPNGHMALTTLSTCGNCALAAVTPIYGM